MNYSLIYFKCSVFRKENPGDREDNAWLTDEDIEHLRSKGLSIVRHRRIHSDDIEREQKKQRLEKGDVVLF